MTIWTKLGIAVTYSIWLVLTTLYVHNKFLDAADLKVARAQVVSVAKGQNEIIKFNQKLRKANVTDKQPKETCFNTDLPDDVRGLLQDTSK